MDSHLRLHLQGGIFGGRTHVQNILHVLFDLCFWTGPQLSEIIDFGYVVGDTYATLPFFRAFGQVCR